MRELSLHILDLIENAIRAGATVISVTVEEKVEGDLISLAIEDDGPGLPVSAERATDPFYTTKDGKKTGLGLSMIKFRTEQAGGRFLLGVSKLGGVAVHASMPLSSVDRSPLGDLAATIASVVVTNPDVDVRSVLRAGGKEWTVSSADIARRLPVGARSDIVVAREVRQRITEGLSALHMAE